MAAQLEEAAGNNARASDLYVRKNLSDRAQARRRRRLFETRREVEQMEREEKGGSLRNRKKAGKKSKRRARRLSTDNNLINGVDLSTDPVDCDVFEGIASQRKAHSESEAAEQNQRVVNDRRKALTHTSTTYSKREPQSWRHLACESKSTLLEA